MTCHSNRPIVGTEVADRRAHLSLAAVLTWMILLLYPIAGFASDTPVVTWDTLSPLDLEAPETQQPEAVQHTTGKDGQATSSLPLANPFDPLNDGRVVIEEWGSDAYKVTNRLIDTEIMVDGYVLPLLWEDDRVVEFLLVPWVGACIHTPAPPPNQIIHVTYPGGLAVDREFAPIRLAGTLRDAPAQHHLFLVDGRRYIPASYALTEASVAGIPGSITASSMRDLPALDRLQIWASGLFTGSMAAIEAERSTKALLSALLLAFAYGVFHTFGPGHGKSVVVSYFVGTGGSLSRGLTMGLRIAIIHVLSAIVVVFAFDLVVRQTTGAAPSDFQAIRMASYGLIMAIGATMLWQAGSAALSARKANREAKEHAHNCDHHTHHHHETTHSGCSACAAAHTTTGSGWIAASVGLVPCTGALLVMLYGLANDLVPVAVMMVIAISAGMALAMSAIGILAIWGRNFTERKVATDGARAQRFEIGTRLVGSACVFAIGCLLFLFTLSSPTSTQLSIQKSSLIQETSLEAEG